jgi:hypothetical protein
MTAKEKAEELVNKYLNASFNCKGCDMPFCDVGCTNLIEIEAKQCALIAVDEILICCIGSHEDYWQQVKQEITNL